MGDLYTAIQALQKRLDEAGIASVVIGGVAVGLWGDPRATRDADLKVLLGRDESDRLLAVLLPDYSSLLPDPQEALRRHGMVFVQSPDGVRLDLLLAETPYDVVVVERGRTIHTQSGVRLRVCRPEGSSG